MRLGRIVVGVIFTALFMSGCSGSNDPEPRSNETEEAPASTSDEPAITPPDNPIPGFEGSCDGFEIWTQNQFEPYGALVRSDIAGGVLAEGVPGNTRLIAVGWFDTGMQLPELVAAKNPEGLLGEVWFYVPDLNEGTGGWVADAGVRDVPTDPSPGNDNGDFKPKTQAVHTPSECKLTPAS